MLTCKMLRSQRGGSVLVFQDEGYHICKKREYDDMVELDDGTNLGIPMKHLNLMCTNRDNKYAPCRGTATVEWNLLTDEYFEFKRLAPHVEGCTWNELNVTLEMVKEQLYQKLRDKVYRTVDDAWDWAVHEFERLTNSVESFPRKEYFRKKGNIILNGELPPLPKNVMDLDQLHIPEALTVTLRGEPFLLMKHSFDHDADEIHPAGRRETIIVFGTSDRFRTLCQVFVAFADGTFKVCPHPFYQLFIIHSIHENGVRMRPCLFCLLTRKTSQTYRVLFSKLRVLAEERGHPIVWTKFRTDFEVAVMNTVEEEFPGVSVTGCYFHLCSAIIKKLREMGFNDAYKDNTTHVKTTVKSIMGLAFLPSNIVAHIFGLIREEYLHPPPGSPPRPNLDNFFEYVQHSWILGGVAEVGRWTIHNLAGKRTNNDLEGYHSRLLGLFKLHPNIWKFIAMLQKEEEDIHIELLQLATGVIPVVSRAVLKRESSLRALKTRYAEGMIAPQIFAKQAGYLTTITD